MIRFGLVALLVSASPARAYENVCTHPKMSGRAFELLSNDKQPFYDGLIEASAIRDGEAVEDVPATNVIHHFYDVRNRNGLHVPSLPITAARTETEDILLGGTSLVGTASVDAITHIKVHLGAAITRYRQGDKQGAYRRLGRILHLTQDLAQPGHVHNDPHVPYNIFTVLIPGMSGGDHSPLESVVEDNCSGAQNVAPGTAIMNPVPGLYYPGNSIPTIEDVAEGLARQAYAAAAFIGTLTVSGPVGQRVGNGSVTVNGRILPVEFVDTDRGLRSGKSCSEGPHWLLQDAGNFLCYDPAQSYDGTVITGFSNDWWEVTNLGNAWRPLPEARRFYFDNYDLVQWSPNVTLTQHFAETLVPQAVDASAAVMKLFAQMVDPKPPVLDVHKDSANGDVVASGNTIDADRIFVSAQDFTDLQAPDVTGVFRIEVENRDTQFLRSASPPIPTSGENPAMRTFANLDDGRYELRAMDGATNIASLYFNVDSDGGPKAVPPADSDQDSPPPGPSPTPGLGVEIDANTGQFGQACAGSSGSGHKPVCVRTGAGTEKCYPAPQDPLCITWACSSPGTYDIPVNFQDDRGNWARTHTIHCHDASPKVKVCTAGQSCQETPLPPNFDLSRSTITAVIEEGTPYCGLGQACQIIEQIGGGKCEIVGFGGCVAIRSSRAYPNALVAAAGMFYAPPENADFLRNQPFTVNFNLNGGTLASFIYPTHGHASAIAYMPALGQPYKNCANDPRLCLAGGGSGGGGGPPWGDGPPPTPQPIPPPPPQEPGAPAPPPDPMQQAAAGMGRAMLGGAIRIGNAASIFGRALTLTNSADVPPYQPTTGAEVCRWTGTTWGCEGPASATCSGRTCALQADLLHASTWAFLAPLPAFYPDLTAPNSTNIQISEDGTAWNAPGPLIQTTNPFVRMTARDPPSGVELISGLAVSSAPLPFASSDPSLVLHLHLDEGSGSQLFDSSRYSSTGTINLTPAWAAGRFGSSLEFTGIDGQQASAPVAARVDGGPFSIEAWVYPTNNANTRTIAKKGTAFSRFFNFSLASGRVQASVGDGSVGYTVTSAEILPLNQWSLVAMSFDGARLRIFANGEQKGEVAADYEGSDSTVVIGLSWLGRIDELRILSRAITRAEAALDYRRGFAALATGDGWRTSRLATQYDLGGLSEGQAGPAVLTASGFSLVRSTYGAGIELAVADVEGHITSTAFQVPVAPADSTPLAFLDAEISSNTSTWHPQGAVALPGSAAFRVKVKDPASGDALRSGIATSTQPTAFSPDPYTQLLLHLDEGTGGFTLDSSARASAVTIQNAPAWTTGRFGGALQFSDDYQFLVPSASPAGLDAPNWTASMWVYPTETANGFLISKQNDGRYGFYLRATGGRPQLNVHNSATADVGGITITAPDVLPLNQWTSLTATSDQNFIRLYVNGELKASAPGYMEPNSAAFVIGAYSSGAASWRGRLDEIRFMSRPQLSAEVLLDYRRGYAALFSSNGGANWTMPALSYGPAVQGDLDAVLSVPDVTLADSLTSNVLQLFAADGAGNASSATFVLPAALDAAPPAPPVIVSTQLAASGAVRVAWQPAPGEVPVSYALYRASEPIASLAGLLPVATTSALNALDAPPAASGDVVYYALTATDLQGNVSAPSASVQTILDHAPPITTLAIEGSSAAVSGVIYVLPASTLTLNAIDQGAAVSGVAAVTLIVDGVVVTESTAPFQLAEGSHQLSYFAADAAGNAEAVRVSVVAVDATAPVSTFSVAGGSTRDSLDRVIIVADQEVVLTAQDSMAGVGGTFYRVDSGTWSPVEGPVTIPEGQHVLQFYAEDVLGNVEAARSQAFVVALAQMNGVSVVSPTATSFTVLWPAMAGAAGYVVVVSSSSDFSTVAFSTAVETQQVAVTGLQASTTYFVRVAFFSDSNDGLPVTVTAFTMSAPSALSLVWTGAAGDGFWHTAGNWSPALMPTSIDSVTIPVAVTVVISSGSPAARFASLVLGDAAGVSTPTLVVAGAIASSGSVVVHNRAILLSDTTAALEAASWDFRSGARATHAATTAARQPVLRLNAPGDILIASGANLDASGRGYSGAGGTPSGPGAGFLRGGGGGHGGYGGGGGDSTAYGAAYDDLLDPTQPGSAGAGTPFLSVAGGDGGGVVILTAGGRVRLDGRVAVDATGPRDFTGLPVGGGAGGSIQIRAEILQGAGTLTARGGDGSFNVRSPGGGGGGGRILIVAATDSSTFSVDASGGRAPREDGSGFNAHGGAGTIVRKLPGDGVLELRLRNAHGLSVRTPTPISLPLSVNALTVSAAVMASSSIPQTVTVSSVMVLSAPYGLYVSSLSFPFMGAFAVPSASTLSVTTMSVTPGMQWNVAGTLLVPALSAGQLDLSGTLRADLVDASNFSMTAGELETSTLTVRFSDGVAIPAGARLKSRRAYLPPGVDWTIGGSLLVGDPILAGTVSILATARISPPAALVPVDIRAAGNLTVASGARITAVGLGHTVAGGGLGAGCAGGGGAGHGGRGGRGGCSSYGPTYDDPVDPLGFGSTGGGDYLPLNVGAAGGGVVMLRSSGVLTMDGVIDVGGLTAFNTLGLRAGGGSGGSINIRAHELRGSGVLKADGGGGNNGAGTYRATESGGGGGGRIAVDSQIDLSSFSFSVRGGMKGEPIQANGVSTDGEAGTAVRLPFVTVSPDAAASLTSRVFGSSVVLASTSAVSGAYSVAVSTLGLYALSPFYEISPSPIVFDPPALFSVEFDPVGVDTATIAIYFFDGVSWDSAAVTAQMLEFLPGGLARVTGTLAHASLYALLAKDSAPPVASLLPPTGSTQTTAAPTITFLYADAGGGVSTSTVRLTLDGVDVTAFTTVTASSAAFTPPSDLAQGTHTATAQVADLAGNRSSSSSIFLVDSAAPITSLLVDGLIAGAMQLVLISTDSIGFAAADVGAGVIETRYAVDGSTAELVFVSTFSLSLGTHTLAYRSVDRAGNTEDAHLVKIEVRSLDSIPPQTTLVAGAPQFSSTMIFVTTATPMGLAVSESARTFIAIDSSAFAAYSGTFTFAAPGAYTVQFYSIDLAGNVEATRSAHAAVDGLPPRTAVSFGEPKFAGSRLYLSSATGVQFAAVDDLAAVGDERGAGVAQTLLSVDSETFAAVVSAVSLSSEGVHVLSWFSRDPVENVESVASISVAVDLTPPLTQLLISAPFVSQTSGTVVGPGTVLSFSAVDPLSGGAASGVSFTRWQDNGGAFSAFVSSLALAEGSHTLTFQSQDNVGNLEILKSAAILVDAAPPVSSLVVGEPRFQLPSVLLVSTRTPFSIDAVDPISSNTASGVKDTQYRVADIASGPAVFSAFTSPFTLAGADVNKVIEFFSRDNVLNAEVVKSSTVLLDSTPPEVALLSPASCGAGICRVLKGKFPVLGAARDAHFGSYRLEFAPGQDASTGFALISSGTVAVSSGTLGMWDATTLSGWLTLRLTAVDLVANTASVALDVFVGDPGQSLVLGNHEVFDMPEGVAVGGDGKIYVSDRNNDRIAIFSSTGAFLVSFGGQKGRDDEKDEDHGKHKESTTTLRLNKPSGVAVDAGGNIYVADTNRDRVLKLSPDGEVLLSLGRRDREDEHERARLPGQFQHPAGIAVDAASNIYVADTGNRRVQVFSSSGAFNFQFNLPPVPARLGHDDDGDEKGDDDDDAESAQLGKPFGIAVDAAGNIYVADPKGGRALKFGATGQLLLTIPIPGDKPGRLGQPFGVAVSADGDCLLVSDRKTSRIFKFDFPGNLNLAFGSKGKIKDDDAPVRSAVVFKKPMGLALDAQGNLFVADRNNDRIQKLGLPTGQAPLVAPPPRPEDEHIARDVVDREDGGKIERRDRAAVDIPAGAVASDLKISVSTPAFSAVDDSNRRRAADDAKLKAASPPVEYGPEGTTFNGAVTLTLPYSQDLVALQNIDAADLKVRYWNRDKSQWEDLESVVDPKTRTVKAKTTHFSLYQVFSGTVSAAAFQPLAADATFGFRDAYAFPNPVRGGNAATIRIQTGLADSVEVRVYDVSGRRMHSSSNFSLNANLDDGNGKGAQYTYDHVWDISGVGSGVYQYVITAKKAGQADIHKTGRIGVVK